MFDEPYEAKIVNVTHQAKTIQYANNRSRSQSKASPRGRK